jgi:hypothetical protein
MHTQLTLIVAQQHIADRRRAADHDRLAQAATTARRSETPTGGRPVAAAPVMLIGRLGRRIAQRTRPHGKAGQVEG